MNQTALIIIYVAAGVFILWLFLYFIPLGLYFKAKTEGVRISLVELISMNSRKAPIHDIVDCLILLEEAGIGSKRIELEAAALSGCNIVNIAEAMIAAKELDFELSFKKAMQAELNGTDLIDVINEAVQKRKDL